MKKILIAFFSFMIVVGSMNAQNLKKDLKTANKLASNYHSDPVENEAQLEEALSLLDKVLQSEEGKMSAAAYLTKADILAKVSDEEINKTIITPGHKISHKDAAIESANAYAKAASIAEKKGDKKSAYSGLMTLENTLSNYGATMYQNEANLDAYKNFSKMLEVGEILHSAGEESTLDVDTVKTEIEYYTVVCGYTSDVGNELLPLLEKMVSDDTDKALVYQILFETLSKSNPDKAIEYLFKGRDKFPDDNGMLFAEINYYLQSGKFDQLILKLEMAIEREPGNVSVYNTLGNVYDQLLAKAKKAGDEAGIQSNFDKAMEFYEKGLAVDKDNHDANYSIGVLYYNKAAGYTESINKYAQDFSAAGSKKYNELKSIMDGLFDKAFPYFEKAAELMPEDADTLTALSEIHVRKGNLEEAAELKKKIEKLNAGQK